ncbi:MAG: hypothetical protein M3069_05635 [Chloroflexota bacterium]|nr:hypothetical protein [Chloroflexota bacterium]
MVTRVVERGPAPINVGDPRRGHLPITRSLTLVYELSSLLAILLVVTSVAGLVFVQRGLYTPDPTTIPAFIGQDALTLLLGLPLLIGSMMLARRGSLGGLVLCTGALFYFAYSVRLGFAPQRTNVLRHARYRNLYFVAASTPPGGGLAIVPETARLNTERSRNDLRLGTLTTRRAVRAWVTGGLHARLDDDDS